MNTLAYNKNYYSLQDHCANSLSTTFCGQVPESVVNKLDFMSGKKVNTLMGFFSHKKNKGYGKELLQQLIEAEKKLGTEYITLGVDKENEIAIKLYKSCGFIIKGNCSKFERMHFMYLDLTSN